MLIVPCDVSVYVANHQLLWHWVYPWALGDSVQVGSRSQWESVQGEVCSAQPTFSSIPKALRMLHYPPHICPTNRELGSNPVYAEEASASEEWTVDLSLWDRDEVLCFQFLYLCILIHSLIILNFNYNIILYNAVSFCCAAKWISYIYTFLF